MSGWKYAFSLSKQQVAEAEPPGTVRLVDHGIHRTRSGRHEEDGDWIHLVPQPSQSPLDPLNWPLWRKLAILITMSLYSFAANIGTSILAPSLVVMIGQLPELWHLHGPPPAFSSLTHLVAVNVLMIGLSNTFWVPLANTFGRRPVLLVAMLLSVLSSMWCGLARSFTSLLAARVVQGCGFGPADTIAPDVVGEIFFLHQRGRALAFYTFFLAGGSTVGGISGSYIAARWNYTYTFWISTGLLAAVFLLQLLLVPETSFDRQAQLILENHPSVTGTATHPDAFQREKPNIETIEQQQQQNDLEPTRTHTSHPMSFAQSLKIGHYRGNLLAHFLDPWRSLLFPGTWVVLLHYGGLLGGIVTISTVGPQYLAMPPYLWGQDVGLLGIGALVGIVVAGVTTFFLADWLITRGKKGGGGGGVELAEPESRLPAIFPALVLATTGIWTFGFSAAHPSQHAWAGMVVGYGMVGFGIGQIPSIGFNYLIDSYNAISADCFVMTTISRAVVSFAWTYFVADWIAADGAALPFGIFGMLMGIFGLLTIPLWLFGKRMRIATAKYLPHHSNH